MRPLVAWIWLVPLGCYPPEPLDTGIPPYFTPIAEAGEDQEVLLGERVELDGSQSQSHDHYRDLAYNWSFRYIPDGSALTDEASPDDNNTTAAEKIRFTPDVAGPWFVELVVTDGREISLPDAVVIEVEEPE